MSLSMRLALVALLSLGACGSAGNADKPQGLVLSDLVRAKVTAAGQAAPVNTAAVLTRDHLRGITEPLIRVRAENTGQLSLLYVAQRNGGAEIWKSPDNASFTLRGGVVTQTRGLGGDLYSADVSGLLAALRQGSGSATRINRRLDGGNAVVPAQLDCEVQNLGAEDVVVLGLRASTRHYRETCEGEGESFTNDYWVDSRGVMRVSRQWIGPEFGMIFMERLID